MKSRTSYFDFAVLKKNITRFAPVWGLYSVGLLLAFLVFNDGSVSAVRTDYMASMAGSMAIYNFGYAFVVAQMLWGDLYNSRMCNALHALPLRREGWFLTGAVSGILFCLVPNTVFALVMLPICGEVWPVALFWLLATMLQYLCFFGIATLSAFLVGNRLGMGIVYFLINFLSWIFYSLLSQLYLPNMYGIVLREEHFMVFAPLTKMVENYDLIEVDWQFANGVHHNISWWLGEGWGYLAICAGLGAVALGLAVLLYRKRQLECAGDLVAVKPLEPVVLVIYTLYFTMAMVSLFGYSEMIYTLIGLTIGFFTGKMLLERQVRVFRKKNFLAFAAVVLVFYGSIVIVQKDALGLGQWVPQAEKVASVTVSSGYGYYSPVEDGLVLEDPAEIKEILEIHEAALVHLDWLTEDHSVRLNLTYQMKSGMQRSRSYWIPVDSQEGQTLKRYLSSREAVLEELDYLGAFQSVEISESGRQITDSQDLAGLLDAIVADCAAGNMAQENAFYPQAEQWHWITLEFKTPEGVRYYRDLRFWEGCENVMAWMDAMGIVFEKYE